MFMTFNVSLAQILRLTLPSTPSKNYRAPSQAVILASGRKKKKQIKEFYQY